MSKPFLNYQDQLIKLRDEKNLIIDDEDFCLTTLQRVGYFSLIGGYKKPFRNPMTRKYINGTTFEDIAALYLFDQQLRSPILNYICIIERKFTNALSYGFCEVFGENQKYYLDSCNYITGHTKDVTKLIGILNYNANKSKEHDYLLYHRKTYGNVPLWVLLHGITFGQASAMVPKTYRNLLRLPKILMSMFVILMMKISAWFSHQSEHLLRPNFLIPW